MAERPPRVERTWRDIIRAMDPEWDREDRVREEFQFSNGRVFTGEYKKRGPYAPSEG